MTTCLHLGLKASACAVAAALALPAAAVTVTVDTTLDLTVAAPPSSGFANMSAGFGAITPFSLAVGDTLDFTIDFAGDQSLTATGLNLAWAFFYADQGDDFTGTGRFSFLDAAGNEFLVSDQKTSSEGLIHFGQQFYGTDFAGGLPTTLTFHGVRYVGTVDEYLDGDASRSYLAPSFIVSTTRLDVNVSPVPEPGTWALGAVGLAAVAGAARRRRG